MWLGRLNMKYIFLFILFFGSTLKAECTLSMKLDGGSISAATYDYLVRGQKKAQKDCDSILLLVNTPGGNLKTTRLIVEQILNSPIPYLCLIYPSGGHAGSAGAIIMQACHVSGAMESTNIGAATPIMATGKDMVEDLRKKIVNDTVSWVDGLTEKRNRNKQFGKELVTEAKSVSAKEAFALGGIDVVTKSIDEFLNFSNGRVVDISNKDGIVKVGKVENFDPDLRARVLEFVADPQFVYLIFMGSLMLLYFEFTHPGVIVPGVIGTIGLLTSLISMHKLEVYWGGLVLMLVGIGFMVAEPFVPSFGVLALGGIISFIMGGLFLFEDNPFGYSLDFYKNILPVAVTFGIMMLILGKVLLNSRKRKKLCDGDQLIGVKAEVIKATKKNKYKVLCEGAIWTAICDDKIFSDEEVEVVSVKGLVLEVKKKES